MLHISIEKCVKYDIGHIVQRLTINRNQPIKSVVDSKKMLNGILWALNRNIHDPE